MDTATLERTTNTTGIIQHVIPLSTAKSIASLAVFASKDKVTPALQVVRVVFDQGKITATATDRYVVGQGAYDYAHGASGTIYLDATAVKFITSYKVTKFQDPMVAFDVLDCNITVKTGDASTTLGMFNGNYPAVESLFESHKPAELAEVHHFRIELLAKLGKVIDTDGSKVESWNFEYGTRTKPERPVPVIATASTFRALIQPNLSRAR
jgi:DNA polymerase III sliding clamp (beta) subunit (PCNA family)